MLSKSYSAHLISTQLNVWRNQATFAVTYCDVTFLALTDTDIPLAASGTRRSTIILTNVLLFATLLS